jgi:hypothetical protein
MSVVMFNTQNSQQIGLNPRAERVALRMPIVFLSSEGRVAGHSADVSISGLLGTFQQPLDVWLTGQLSLVTPQGRSILIRSRIVRVDGYRAALSFATLSAHERATLLVAIEAAGGSDQLVLPGMDRGPRWTGDAPLQQDEYHPPMAVGL